MKMIIIINLSIVNLKKSGQREEIQLKVGKYTVL